MKKLAAIENVWVVVYVYHGVATDAYAYRDEQSARRKEKELRRKMDENDDAVNIFYVKVNGKSL